MKSVFPKIMLIEPRGRLGNRLQACAFAIAFCEKYGYSAMLIALNEYAAEFEGCRNNPFCIYPHQNTLLRQALYRQRIQRIVKRLSRVFMKIPLLQKLFRVYVISAHSDCMVTLTDPNTYIKIKKSWFCFLLGHYYLCDQMLVMKHKQKIIEYFTPLPSVNKQISAFLEKYKKE